MKPVAFEVGQTKTIVPGDQVDILLEQLARPRAGQTGAEAAEVAGLIQKAHNVGPPPSCVALIDQRLALALLAAIDDVYRDAGLKRETLALRQRLRSFVGVGTAWSESSSS